MILKLNENFHLLEMFLKEKDNVDWLQIQLFDYNFAETSEKRPLYACQLCIDSCNKGQVNVRYSVNEDFVRVTTAIMQHHDLKSNLERKGFHVTVQYQKQ